MHRHRLHTLFSSLAVSLALGCSSVPENRHHPQDLVYSTLRIRRPAGPGADPRVGPGGMDYRSNPLPNERFDCETLDQLFSSLSLESVRRCFEELASSPERVVEYRLRREAQPFFELLDPEDAPACLSKDLLRLPVPREIIFQTVNEGNLNCYSNRVHLEADQVMGIALPIRRFDLTVALPLLDLPRDDEELIRILAGWSLRPFWGEKGVLSDSKRVPERLCRACLGARTEFRAPPGIEIPLYPEREATPD